VINDGLSPDLRGLIDVLAAVLVREIEREMAEAPKEPKKGPEEAPLRFLELAHKADR
jgi:hypothetical protein